VTDPYDDMFGALCVQLGFCLHEKGQKKVIAALPNGLDAAVKAVFEADGMDIIGAPGGLKRQVRDCIKAHLPG
jgi:hypothetical protein